ncbi:hypothetical protein LY76DRAFT_59028 [Colletotrichum caudatum]|nr:hypothetical protein LY76DRAFT_59028 [Colletotrichum caudatum]
MAPGSSKLFVPGAAAAAAAAAVTSTLHGESAVRRRLFPGRAVHRETPSITRVSCVREDEPPKRARNMLPGPPSSPPPSQTLEQSTGMVKPPSSRHWIPTRCSGIANRQTSQPSRISPIRQLVVPGPYPFGDADRRAGPYGPPPPLRRRRRPKTKNTTLHAGFPCQRPRSPGFFARCTYSPPPTDFPCLVGIRAAPSSLLFFLCQRRRSCSCSCPRTP